VHLALLPEVDDGLLALAEDVRAVTPAAAVAAADELQAGPSFVWEQLLDIRSAGLIKLEALRNAGFKNSLDTEAVFLVPADATDTRELIETYHKELEDLLGVGYTRIETGDAPEGLLAGVEIIDTRESYERCARSWKRRPDVGSDSDYPDLCARDAAVVRELA